jgi:hypothetical protein
LLQFMVYIRGVSIPITEVSIAVSDKPRGERPPESPNSGKGKDWIIWSTYVNIFKHRYLERSKRADRLGPKRACRKDTAV